MKKFYSDRVTTLYAAPGEGDSFVVHEVTLEDTKRETESVDFETVAFCTDKKSANTIANSLMDANCIL